MKKFLPVLIIFFFVGLFFTRNTAFADTPPTQQFLVAPVAPDGSWVLDPEVTFIGKNAARSGNLLDFTLENYNWVCVTRAANGQCDNNSNPLVAVWQTTAAYIVAPLLLVIILVAALVIIITRGRSLTIMRFLPRFGGVILLIFLSFALLQFFYQFMDLIQGFFLRSDPNLLTGQSCPPLCISQKDLLFVGWKYETFEGLRRLGPLYDESAFISLLLTKLTALTYYVMVGILFLRRIILWLFIIVSPIFPLLLMFYPIRNTGKIWIGEFFRWLLYAPLFAIFLRGLVSLWRNQIPLSFTPADPAVKINETIIYPTAINILLGGPKQFVTQTNSVNLTETFALYVVSLLMLWGVIILPWILLQIFLDYASNIGVGDSNIMKNLVNTINSRQNPPSPAGGHPTAPTGASISLPFTKKFSMPPPPPAAPTGLAREIPVGKTETNISHSSYMPTAQVKAQVLSLAQVTLPSMRDIAKYDTSLISRDTSRQKEAITIRDNLVKIANPSSVSSSSDRERYTEIREKLIKESNSGNTLATSILTAATASTKRSSQATTSQIKSILTQIANPQIANSQTANHQMSTAARGSNVINHEKISKMNESLVQAKKQGSTLATAILSVNSKTSAVEIEKLQEKIRSSREKGEPIGIQLAQMTERKELLPLVNRVQTVSKEDYQAVKQMWKENYKNLEVPAGMSGTRNEWVKDDISKIDTIVSQLGSRDEEKIAQGMEEVSSILPFLLVGGFSQTEITAYLKAKQDAAKEVITELAQDEEDKVEVVVKKTQATQQTMSASIPQDSDEEESSLSSLSSVSKAIVAPQVTSQATNEILKLTNLELPKLADIVKYEIRSLTKDKTESERAEKMHSVLERIGNPTNITTEAERKQYEDLREKLGEESINGNATASTILLAVSSLNQATSEIEATLTELKTVLKQIANPQNVESTEDRDYYTRLHEYLETESKQNNNKVAQSILNVNETTKTSDIQNIKEQLSAVSNTESQVLPQISSAVKDFVKVKQLRSLLQQVASQAPISKNLNQNYDTLKVSLRAESLKGNGLATSIMAINDTTSDVALKEVHKQIIEVGQKGEPLATSIISLLAEQQKYSGPQGGIPLEELKTTLTQIANPSNISSAEDRTYYAKLHDYVENESKEKNNSLAQRILSVNETAKIADIQEIEEQLMITKQGFSPALPQVTAAINKITELKQLKEVIKQIISGASPVTNADSERIVKTRQLLGEASAKGDVIATSLLSVNDKTSDTALLQLNKKLIDASKKGDSTAKAILAQVSEPLASSSASRLQSVKQEDYDEAKKLWEKAYIQYFVPPGFTEDLKGRMEWINKDIADIQESISLLESPEADKKNAGTKKVSNILPFLLLGGFSFSEMIKYLKTKLEAAQSAITSLNEEEDKSVSLNVKNDEDSQDKTMSEEIPEEEKKQ